MATAKNTEIDIVAMRTGRMTVAIVGTSPLIMNKKSLKTIHELLFPRGPKSKIEKETTLKHDPMQEFRDSVYSFENPLTHLGFPAPGFKASVAGAALDMPGVARTTLGRLLWVKGVHIPIFGVPQIFMCGVKQGGINKTPDIRTRAILPRWAAIAEIEYVKPNLTEKAVVSLVSAAGIVIGLGDFRPEKGKGAFGQYRWADPDDAELCDIMRGEAKEAQLAAMKQPTPYDADTEELLIWFHDELKNRDRQELLEAAQ